ncbi:putative mitochondrial quinone oxidoreductase-like protein [Leptomonas pyrrhocoris]|uniref:Putative mitochondrial quinone oxidoreductase-like protein n=1 Tax=Leptomonas pyrrhocoris TaxID=157538 RepID=A0A0N0VGM4_LEPPY|nr:putative mitochondrial quinone oxidoreductase-like protein [Leptomonas pyrrhocoris]KPA83954.1 putative mitochondrial quinone oxidoreductase-like protein [Leptomonas pyrrhocoris]|eukprot:XP_015662393.1 putative mitochondrial quinone oxidoreductase-like protein [Leptomonas pyrrhocoris]
MMRAVVLKGFGGVDMMSVAEVPMAAVKRSTDVLIKVMAAGVNRADLSQRRGHYPPPPGATDVMGLEVAGVVAQVGSGVDSSIKEGDNVMALLPGGGYAEYAVAQMGCVMPMPQGYSFTDAAAVPETFITAWQILNRHGKVKPRQRVLIHAGASGIGSACAQITEKYFKATAITTSSEAKLDVCKGYASVTLSRTKDEAGWAFAPKVKKLFGEESIHVIVDPVFGGTYLSENSQLLAPNGHLVVVAFMGGSLVQMNALPFFRENAQITFTKLRCRSDQYKTTLVESFEQEIVPYLNARVISPVINRTFTLEEVGAAHTYIEENRGYGKVVLVLADAPQRPIL